MVGAPIDVGVAGIKASSGAERVRFPVVVSRSKSGCWDLGWDLGWDFSFFLGFFSALGLSSASYELARSASAFSVFRFSSHHSEPVASHASLNTEWTICPVSNPMPLRSFSSFLSKGVEKMTGAGVLSKEEKSWCIIGESGVGMTASS